MRTGHAILAALALAAAQTSPVLADEDPWPAIREMVWGGRELRDGSGVLGLEAPVRAADAAVVPVTITALRPQAEAPAIRTLWLVIDANPAPVAGVFHLSPASGSATIATRVRVNAYTNIHAVAETADGQLWAVGRFVKAAGGCSAPALKDKDAVMARLGQMRLKLITPVVPGQVASAQLLVSHPNYTGMQMDQVSRNWIPPDYVRSISVSQDGETVLSVDGDISIAEDPSITFSFVPATKASLDVAVTDSEGRQFRKAFELNSGS